MTTGELIKLLEVVPHDTYIEIDNGNSAGWEVEKVTLSVAGRESEVRIKIV